MGTVVFRAAPLKIYLTASPEERARRRYNQLKEKGFDANLAALVEDIRNRDARDMGRDVRPLKPADDALVIDSTDMTFDAVLHRILNEAQQRNLIDSDWITVNAGLKSEGVIAREEFLTSAVSWKSTSVTKSSRP
jgi:CMP/dCMP kinase